MSASFTLDFVNDYIRVLHPVDYEITPQSQEHLWAEIGEACRRYDCRYVLAESLTPPRRNMNRLDAFKSAGQAANASSDLRMAFFFPDYKTDDTTEFFITSAYNRGVRVEFFSDREEAVKWLVADRAN
jgi:hypothetical protein